MTAYHYLLRVLSLLLCLSVAVTFSVLSEQTDGGNTKAQASASKSSSPAVGKDKENDNASAEQTPEKSPPPVQLLRIGSGAVGGNYFVLGELVGGVVSHPLGSLPCNKGGTCGVPNLQSQNVTSVGSLENLNKLDEGDIDAAFVQSDLAYWAYTSAGPFENKDKREDLRAIASLYPEAMHVLVRKSADIKSVADMVGKRISVGARKSGTLYSSRLLLAAYNVSEDDMETAYLNSAQSMEKLLADELDGMFFTVGAPAPAMEKLFADSSEYTLLSIGSAERKAIFEQGHYFSPYTIAAGTYTGIPAVETVSVYALLLTTDTADKDLVYQLTKSLWGDAAQQLFASSHIGKEVVLENSLKGIGIPLHDGAKQYYNEIGKRF